MKKVVLKSALITLAAIVVLALVASFIACFGFPRKMALASEKLGNYGFAADFSRLSYRYTGEAEDLGSVVRYSIFDGDDKTCEKYGEKLIAHRDFEKYCAESDVYYAQTEYGEYTGSYKQFLCGNISCAAYRRGDFAKGLQIALGAQPEGFPKNCALAQLSLCVCGENDGQAAQKMKDTLSSQKGITESEQEYFNAIITELTTIIDSNKGE